MKTPLKSLSRAFTLVEIMIAMTILGFASLGVMRFTIQALNIYHYDSGRVMVNRDIRTFTEQMTTNAVYSNYFRIFPSFSSRTVVNGGVTSDNVVNDGLSGDMMVLVFCDTDLTNGKTTINRLIGYYRDPADPNAATSTGPVRKFDVTVSPAFDPGTSTSPIASLLNTYVTTGTAHTNPVVVQLAQGLSNGTLFYNFYDRSVMVKGQIIEQGNQFRRAVNTYNFTVSPRG